MKVAIGAGEGSAVRVDLTTSVENSSAYVFQSTSPDYDRVLTSCLRHLLADFGK
jgi:shikimate kinase